MKCVCEDPKTYHNSGYKGILARIKNDKIASKVERCDTCCLYKSDLYAKRALLRFLEKLKGTRLVSVRVSLKDLGKQKLEVDKYLKANQGFLERKRERAFEGIHNILTLLEYEAKKGDRRGKTSKSRGT